MALGISPFSRSRMDCAPKWIPNKAVDDEIKRAWGGAFVEIYESEVHRGASVIGSNIVYKFKQEAGSRSALRRIHVHMVI